MSTWLCLRPIVEAVPALLGCACCCSHRHRHEASPDEPVSQQSCMILGMQRHSPVRYRQWSSLRRYDAGDDDESPDELPDTRVVRCRWHMLRLSLQAHDDLCQVQISRSSMHITTCVGILGARKRKATPRLAREAWGVRYGQQLDPNGWWRYDRSDRCWLAAQFRENRCAGSRHQ